MPKSWRQLLFGLLLLLGAGAGIGWLYDRPLAGLAIAALGALAWHLRRLYVFEQAVSTRNFDAFRQGEGIWQQIFSRYRYANERAEKHKQRHRRLLSEIRKSTNAMPDGAVILDDSNQILMCNRAAKQLVGLKPRKDRGQRVDNILRHPELTALLAEGDYSQSIEIPSPLDPSAWLNCRVVPYGADEKLLLLRDVTERTRLNKMRRDFVANASHELRSPLTVISGYLDSFDDDELPDAWAYPIRQMQSQANRMKSIITELLELSRLESAGPARRDDLVDVPALLARAKHLHRDDSGIADIDLDIRSTAQLRGNDSQVESVIVNLLSNAIRHTAADGRITLSWQAGKKGADLTVSDSGEGIAAEDIPRITERFFRVSRGRAREDGGTGLGLAIVKHILSRHGAELEITSEVGNGSRFRCRFPADRVVEPRAAEAASG